jgi:ABC-2 type transport system permease protein
MSTSTLTPPIATSVAVNTPADEARLTFGRLLRSEWVKFRTLRSTVWTLALTVVLMAGTVSLLAAGTASQDGAAVGTAAAEGGSTAGFQIAVAMAQLAVVVLGVLVITGEYSTGMIRSTLTAVPRRLPALWAKGVILAGSIFVVSTIAVGISLAAMQLILGHTGLAPDLGDGDTIRVLMGIPLYLTAIALLAFAIGALLRHSAGALTTVLGLLIVIETMFMFPWRPFQLMGPFLPSSAGTRIIMPQGQIDALAQIAAGAVLGPWQGYAVLLVWVAVPLTVAAVLLKKRNA